MTPDSDWMHRYSRQILLKEIGGAGQRRLNGAVVGLAGEGGVLAPVALQLAAAGVETLERVAVEGGDDTALRAAIAARNADVRLVRRPAPGDLAGLVAGWDLAIVNTMDDEMRHRYALACQQGDRPFLAVWMRGGLGLLILNGGGRQRETVCWHRFSPTPMEKAPVVSIDATRILAGVLAGEAMKHLLNIDRDRPGRWIRFDPLTGEFATRPLIADADCRRCGETTGKE